MTAAIGKENRHDFDFLGSIPVLRMLDEEVAKAFYLKYLGYVVEWEHRSRPDPSSPLYMQIRQGESVLHLNGHADADTPPVEVRIPMRGLEAYCRHLASKASPFETPEVVDPRYEGRKTDLNIVDPFQNHLVFWAPGYLTGES